METKLYNGDCLEVLKQISDNSIDLVVTSPPYNLCIKYNSYSDDLSYSEYLEWCKNGYIYVKQNWKIMEE